MKIDKSYFHFNQEGTRTPSIDRSFGNRKNSGTKNITNEYYTVFSIVALFAECNCFLFLKFFYLTCSLTIIITNGEADILPRIERVVRGYDCNLKLKETS